MNEWYDSAFIAVIASLVFIAIVLFQFFINLLMPPKKPNEKK